MSKIPNLKRESPLIVKLLPILITGFDEVIDNESKLYLRLLSRLADKAFDEYILAKKCIDEEIKTGDKLKYRFQIINHLENCTNAISRCSKIITTLNNGVCANKSNGLVKPIKKNIDLLNLASKEIKEKLFSKNAIAVRNRVEHIDEDIYLNKFQRNLFLDVDENYENMTINKKKLSFIEASNLILNYYKLIEEIFNNLPIKKENGQYFYKK